MIRSIRNPCCPSFRRKLGCGLILWFGLLASSASLTGQTVSFDQVVDQVQPKMVKIYGAGGLRGLEHYQSGFLISDQGHVLTVWSYVLDTDLITVVLHDGRKYQATLLGYDPRLEIAVLKVDADQLDAFDLSQSVDLAMGSRVLTFSNLFGVATGNEPTSVLHGSVAAKTDLTARRGAFATPYQGPVYILDAMTNNPGSAGGAMTNRRGQLAGILGKELRDTRNNLWLNYAIPVQELVASVRDIREGKFVPRSQVDPGAQVADPVTLSLLGLVLVPDVVANTPPFIDAILPNSPAEQADLRPDDLIIFIDDRLMSSCRNVIEELSLIDRAQPIRLSVQRGQEIIHVTLQVQN